MFLVQYVTTPKISGSLIFLKSWLRLWWLRNEVYPY